MDEHFMKIALDLAHSVKGQTSPNPPVGAVVVKDGSICGMGAHLKAGTQHAEVHALEMAGDNTVGATIYVTLEPCSHFGKTAPCADFIIAKKVARVVVAISDPNEKVAGQGIARLRESGVEVSVGILRNEAKQLYDVFFHYLKTKQPYITLKTAMSLDGKIATKTGESKWISSEESRRDVHHYRQMNDAILVGVNTILVDDPMLTTRLGDESKHPIRIILDTNLRTPLNANVIANQDAKTVIFVSNSVKTEKIQNYKLKNHVEVIQLETMEIDVAHVVAKLGKMGITSLYVEGGATINDAFLQANLINEYIIYLAPKLIGGKAAPTAIAGEGFEQLSDVFSLLITKVEKIGDDIKIIAKQKGEE